jgi:hypothetical protein
MESRHHPATDVSHSRVDRVLRVDAVFSEIGTTPHAAGKYGRTYRQRNSADAAYADQRQQSERRKFDTEHSHEQRSFNRTAEERLRRHLRPPQTR